MRNQSFDVQDAMAADPDAGGYDNGWCDAPAIADFYILADPGVGMDEGPCRKGVAEKGLDAIYHCAPGGIIAQRRNIPSLRGRTAERESGFSERPDYFEPPVRTWSKVVVDESL
jgi:hypothetical protein